MNTLIAVAAGGAIGSMGRFLLADQMGRLLGTQFPYGTLTVNVLGCCLMGVLLGLLSGLWTVGLEVRTFLTVGLLGGFTTFSAFSLEVVALLQRGEVGLAALYAAASVVLSVGALFLGLSAVRMVLS